MRRGPYGVPLLLLLGLLLAAGVDGIAGARGAEGAAGESSGSAAAEELAHPAAILDVPGEKLRALQRACRDAGFTAEEFSRLLALVTRAKLAGLPHQQLLSKLDEGLAKRALPERVLAALEDRARHLRAAKEVVDQLIVQGWFAPDYPLAIGMVADALGAGARPADLVRAVRDGGVAATGAFDVRAAFVGVDPGRR